MLDLQQYLKERAVLIERALAAAVPPHDGLEARLFEAMRYSLLDGGKRLRPILALASCEAVGGSIDDAMSYACALEMIHTYSLIHDDLPAIDNDDYRRGKPTCHKVFGEAVALLAGDGLLTEAFRLMTHSHATERSPGDEALLLDLISEVAQAAGVSGMVGGQVVDIESEGKPVDLPTVQYIHTHKTGAMILASVRVGARLGGAKETLLKALTRYGESLGLSFQIADDILNVEGKAALMGKQTGTDLFKRKATYPSVLGVEESKIRSKELVEMAIDALKQLGPEADPLREIARFIIAREY